MTFIYFYMTFPSYWECHHPNWVGIQSTYQPDMFNMIDTSGSVLDLILDRVALSRGFGNLGNGMRIRM